tara:strand:- start:92611 stop:93627 length:1017 start_codon:yes stop_codon:yes gene_type:complete
MNLKNLKKILNKNIHTILSKLEMEYEDFGDNIYSTCPIHEGSDNPRAFSFCCSKGIWKCWTRDCQQEYRNDIFGLIQGVLSSRSGEEVGFSDVLRWISKETNIEINYSNKEAIEEIKGEIEEINDIFKTRHRTSEDKEIEQECNLELPSQYFINRGFLKSTIKHFQVGDCKENGIMKERAIIPIHNDTGKVLVGTIGRSIKEYRTPKFLIYPKGFDKKRYFYNFHRAIKHAKNTNCLYILEGQGDVWRMHEAGVKNAVSVFGKTISKEQIDKLKKLPITHLIVITDNDQAGREARIQIQRTLSRLYKITFPKIEDKDVGDMSVKDIKSKILTNLKGTF